MKIIDWNFQLIKLPVERFLLMRIRHELTFWARQCRMRWFSLARGRATLDRRWEELTHFGGFCDTTIWHRVHCKCPWPSKAKRTLIKSETRRQFSIYQLKYHFFLVQMLQFISRQSLRSVNTTRCAVLVWLRSRGGIVLWVNAEEGRCAINRIYNRFQQSTALELMCWDFPTWLIIKRQKCSQLYPPINLNLPDRSGCARSTPRRALLLTHMSRWWNEHHHVVASYGSGWCMSNKPWIDNIPRRLSNEVVLCELLVFIQPRFHARIFCIIVVLMMIWVQLEW